MICIYDLKKIKNKSHTYPLLRVVVVLRWLTTQLSLLSKLSDLEFSFRPFPQLIPEEKWGEI